MYSNSEFVIPYLGLSNGQHYYSFCITDAFWRRFETSKISHGEMKLEVVFDKLERLVTLSIECVGSYRAACDRCLTEISVPIQFSDAIIIKMQEGVSDEEEVVLMDPKTSQIDIAPLLYESIHVHMPILNIKDCESEENKDCDADILSLLNRYSSDEDNNTSPEIWDELDKLNLN